MSREDLVGEEASARPLGDILRGCLTSLDDADGDAPNDDPAARGHSNWSDVDSIVARVLKSRLVILASRPGVGKTSLAIRIALRVALAEEVPRPFRGVGFWTLEMPLEALVKRMARLHAGLPLDVPPVEGLSPLDLARVTASARVLSAAPVWVEDAGGVSVPELCERVSRLARRQGLAVAFVDYLQLVRCRAGGSEGQRQAWGAACAALRSAADETGVPVVVLSHLRRPLTEEVGREPQPRDIPGWDAVAPSVDAVCVLRRAGGEARDMVADWIALAAQGDEGEPSAVFRLPGVASRCRHREHMPDASG